MSEELTLPFSPATKQNWLDKIKEDLKGKKSPEEFLIETEGILIDPFVTEEESNPALLPLDRMMETLSEGVYFRISDAESDRTRLLRFLESGGSSIFLHLIKEIDPAALLDGVHLDYIFTIIHTDSQESARQFIKYVELTYPDKGLNTFICVNHVAVFPEKTLFFEINISQDITGSLTRALQLAKPTILSDKPARCIFHCTIGKNFLWSVSALRALRVLWENIVSEAGFEGDIPAIVACLPANNELSSDPNQALIELSYNTLAANLGNADIFYTDFPGSDPNDIYRHRAFLIQQVFREEGKLSLVKDPVAGSFYVEQVTRKIAEKVWENL